MAGNSFYDLDYLITINEKRAEQFLTAYQKVVERLTNIVLIYSAFTIFLIPIIQDVFLTPGVSMILYVSFGLFVAMFIISLIFTIKLIIPVQVAYLDEPDKYYKGIRIQYEQNSPDPANFDQNAIDQLIKGSYILELEEAVQTNNVLFKRKNSFFYNSLTFGLLAAVPYLICLGFHITKKTDTVQKVQIVNCQNK